MSQKEEPKVWITISEKINVGNFESIEIQAGYSKCYSDKEDPKELLNKGIEELQSIVEKKAKKIRKRRRRN